MEEIAGGGGGEKAAAMKTTASTVLPASRQPSSSTTCFISTPQSNWTWIERSLFPLFRRELLMAVVNL
jgi:hypothetical protein